MKLGKEKKGEGGREEGCTKRKGVDGRREWTEGKRQYGEKTESDLGSTFTLKLY